MIDLSPIQQYIIKPNAFMIEFVPHEIESVGLNRFLEYSLESLDCTRVWPNGMRPMQTIGYTYIHEVTQFIHTVKTYVKDSEQDDWFNRLLKQHNINVEYEKTNPPVWYGDKKSKDKFNKEVKNKTKVKHNNNVKQTDTSKKLSVAERKLAAKVAKLNSLSIKIKPIN